MMGGGSWLLNRLKESRVAQAAVAVALVGAVAFTWWTISPLFLTTTLQESLPLPGSTASPVTTSTAATASPRVLAMGQLQRVDDIHRGRGPVRLVEVEGTVYVRFENVAIQNGPDLHVYLGRGKGGAYDPKRDLYLGPLKATNGSFNYQLPLGTSTADYMSVIVWCRAFSVLFTWADLR